LRILRDRRRPMAFHFTLVLPFGDRFTGVAKPLTNISESARVHMRPGKS
jgi:hypothetical protein